MKAPVIIIIGEVVTLADELDWFQSSLEQIHLEEGQAEEIDLHEKNSLQN
jgi:hypothetical protein